MMGYEEGEDCPERLDHHIHPEDISVGWDALSGIVHDIYGNHGCDVELRLAPRNQEHRWYCLVGKTARHQDGTPDTFYGIIVDIHERKMKELAAQEEIDQTEDSYRMLRHLIKSGMWSIYYDEDGNRSKVEWSDEFRRMLGYTDETDFPNALESWSALLHPDDWSAGYDTIDPAVYDKTGTIVYDVEYRLKTKDRGYRWFRATGDVYRRTDGSPYRFFGVFFDIDDQKRHDALEAEKDEALKRAQTVSEAMKAIYEAVGSVSWSVEYNEKAERISVIWSDSFRKMLGFQDENDFPNTFEAWAERLHLRISPVDKRQGLSLVSFGWTNDPKRGWLSCHALWYVYRY